MTPRFACSLRKEDVLGDRQVRDQRQLLVDDDDALLLAVADGVEAALLALVEELAVVCPVRVDARHDLHQGRLAGSVLANQRMDLAWADGERDTSFNALTPGNSLVMPRISSRTSLTAPLPSRPQSMDMKTRVCVVEDRRTPAMIRDA